MTTASNTGRSPTAPSTVTSNDVRPHRDDSRLEREHVTDARGAQPLDARLLDHDVPAEPLEVRVERAQPRVDAVVHVREVVRVEHDALHVDLAVADTDLVPEAHALETVDSSFSSRLRYRSIWIATGLGTGATGRRPSRHRDARLEQLECVVAEVRVRLHELGQRHAPFDRVAHECADERVRLAERHPTLDEQLGEVGRGRSR